MVTTKVKKRLIDSLLGVRCIEIDILQTQNSLLMVYTHCRYRIPCSWCKHTHCRLVQNSLLVVHTYPCTRTVAIESLARGSYVHTYTDFSYRIPCSWCIRHTRTTVCDAEFHARGAHTYRTPCSWYIRTHVLVQNPLLVKHAYTRTLTVAIESLARGAYVTHVQLTVIQNSLLMVHTQHRTPCSWYIRTHVLVQNPQLVEHTYTRILTVAACGAYFTHAQYNYL